MNRANLQSQRVINRGHHLCITLGQIVICSCQVSPRPEKTRKRRRQCGGQCFPLTSLHLSNAASMHHQTADELDVIMTHPQMSLGGFSHERKRLWQQVIQGFATLSPVAKSKPLLPKCLWVLALQHLTSLVNVGQQGRPVPG